MCAQFIEQMGAEHDIAILAAFAVLDMHHHARRVDVGEFEGRALGATHASGIEGHEDGAVKAFGAASIRLATSSGLQMTGR